MEKMSNENYEKLCGILDDDGQGHVVRNILLTPGDFQHAREKLAKYFTSEFTNIQIYSSEMDAATTKHEQTYVSMTWKSLSDVSFSQENNERCLSSYLDVFKKLKKHRATHLTVTGSPGAGKTTFMKHICNEWAMLVQRKKDPFKETALGIHPLEHYTFVLPIILRLVKKNQTLTNIIREQFSKLSKLHLHCMMMAVEEYTSDVLLIFDGYDELTPSQEDICDIIKKAEYHNATLVVTTRPHGLTLMRQLGSGSIDQQVELLGFSDFQIKKYISLRFPYDDNLVQGLIVCLFKERPDLYELAHIPIHLQMICVVWRTYKSLGSNTVELYLMFITCLLDHLERKNPELGKSSEKKILENHSHLLCELGMLASRWHDSHLQTTFSYEELVQTCQYQYPYVVEMGCIAKSHPSSELSKSFWSFTHLTIQEFFVAYHLSKQSDETRLVEFSIMCSQVSNLERNKVILKFLGGLSANKAVQILKLVIIKTKQQDACKRLMDILLDVMSEFKSISDVDLPVPWSVDIDHQLSKFEKELKQILFKGSEENRKYIHELSTCNFANPIYRQCLKYIKTLNLKINSVDHMNSMARVMPMLQSLNTFSVHVPSELGTDIEYTFQELLLNAPLESLSTLKIEIGGIIRPVTTFIGKAPVVKTLILHLLADNVVEADVQALCLAIENANSISEVQLELDKLSNAILVVSNRVKMALILRQASPSALDTFLDGLRETPVKPGITSLEFAGENSFQDMGRQLGQLICLLPNLTVLNLGDCGIKGKTVQQMKDVSGKSCNVKCLLLRNNDLESCSIHLGNLVTSMPDLLELDLRKCKMQSDDLSETTNSLKECTSLKHLRLRANGIDKPAAESLGHLWSHVPNLEVLDMWYCGMEEPVVPPLFDYQSDRLKKLQVLNMGCNPCLSDEGLKQLTFFLHSMSFLEALSVANCGFEKVATLSNLIDELPSKMKHLDVRDNYLGTEILELMQQEEQKKRMAKLERLNIGDPYEKGDYQKVVKAIKEELLTIKPDIQVYYDDCEDMWAIYVENK